MDKTIEFNILSQVAIGDETAFKQIVKKYWHNIYCHSLAYMKSGPIAEEITQDIFMRLWDNRKKLGEINNFENYLFILSRNQIISELRKKLQQIEPLQDELVTELNFLPDQQIEFKETYQILLKGIELLPEKRREVFKKSRLEGKTHEQIANELGIHKDTVSQYIVKALIFLRTYLYENSDNRVILLLILSMIL